MAACTPTLPSPSPSAAGSPSAPVTPAPTRTAAPTPAAIPEGAGLVDATLLEHLPVAIEGVPMEADPDTAAGIASVPAVKAVASGLAVARYLGGDPDAPDLAIASVVRFQPGVADPAFLSAWRADYDTGVCEAAGGVSASDQAVTIGGHDVLSGACAGGARTYHVQLDDDTIVAITAVGSGRFGERVIEGLR